ncbi:MAG TPA: rhamnogalacturonan acetylesterase [Opitutaceae bacterium]|jgi:lysophospholipase L1-like esterase
MRSVSFGIAAGLAFAVGAAAAEAPRDFVFGTGSAQAGAITVPVGTRYSPGAGYGFEPGAPVRADARGCASDRPFWFSVAEPEGNYRVDVELGDSDGASDTTVRAELRRLVVEPTAARPGELVRRSFLVNIRTPDFGAGGTVRLKPRERTGEIWDWDAKLTLEFDGPHPAVSRITVTPVTVPTVYLAGDSTLCDQPYEPYCSWGQILPDFLGLRAAVANHAESGESLRSFADEHRIEKLDTLMKPGDYLFVQFGHNDQKLRGPGVGASTTFRAALEHLVSDARAHGTHPALITAVSRRTFGADGKIQNSLGDFPEVTRQVAAEMKVPLIDLNALSTTLYEALGPEGAKALFPTVNGKLEGTHHNDYGAYEIAKCVVEGMRRCDLPIAPAVPAFNPAQPDPVSAYAIPSSPLATHEIPYGN